MGGVEQLAGLPQAREIAMISGLNSTDQNLAYLMQLYGAGGDGWSSMLDQYNPYQATGYDQNGNPIGQNTSGPRMFDSQWLSQFDSVANNPIYTSMYGPAPVGGTTQQKLDWMGLVNMGGAAEAGRQTTEAENSRTDMTEGALMAAAMAGVGGLAYSGAGLLSGAEGIGGAAGSGFVGDLPIAGDFSGTSLWSGGGLGGSGGWGDLINVADAGDDIAWTSQGFTPTMVDNVGGGGIMDWLGNIPASSWLNFGGSALNSLLGYNASQNASTAQQQAANNALALQAQIYAQNRADLAPWREAGVGALGRLTALTTPGNQVSQMELDPGYQFRLGEGNKAIDRASAARGGFDSGRSLKALTRYGQDYASNEFGNVYNRLAGLAGTGQTATTNTAQLGQSYANQASDLTTQAGNARASGYIGGAQNIAGGINAGLNAFNMYNWLPNLRTYMG
jgi:hypothetical protein